MKNRVFVCADFKGHFPVGTAAIIVARDSAMATGLLMKRLSDIGLPQENFRVQELSLDEEGVVILNDGDY